jgi:hypothetical protein
LLLWFVQLFLNFIFTFGVGAVSRQVVLLDYCQVPVVVTKAELAPAVTVTGVIGVSAPLAPMLNCETSPP